MSYIVHGSELYWHLTWLWSWCFGSTAQSSVCAGDFIWTHHLFKHGLHNTFGQLLFPHYEPYGLLTLTKFFLHVWVLWIYLPIGYWSRAVAFVWLAHRCYNKLFRIICYIHYLYIPHALYKDSLMQICYLRIFSHCVLMSANVSRTP